MKLDTALLQRAIPDGSMRYFAWLYTPQDKRDALAALFLLESELRDTANAPHDVAHIRLQWWRDEIDRLNRGNAQHPATQVLQASRSPTTDFTVLDGLLLSTAQDIAHSTYETDVELLQYARGYASLYKLAALLLNGAPTSAALDAAEKLGSFIRTIETLRDLRLDVHHGRLYLPLSEMDKLNIEYQVLESKVWPSEFVQWLTIRCNQLLQQQQQIRQALLKTEAAQLRPLLVLATLHEKLLDMLIKNPSSFDYRAELKPFSKLWTAWRIARII